MILEKDFQRQLITFLLNNGAYTVKYEVSEVAAGGTPDVLASINGIFVGIELKTESKLTYRQALRLIQINESGGAGIVIVWSPDWRERLSKIIELKNPKLIREKTDIDYYAIVEKEKWD